MAADVARMADAIRQWLHACGLDPAHADLASTPERVARVWATEFLAGYDMDPAAILGDPVVGEADPDVVVVGGLRFHAMCPHHLLPYRGVAHVAYLPEGQAGRLRPPRQAGRLLHEAADAAGARDAPDRRSALPHLGARGAGCVIEAEQMCLALPGEKHDTSARVPVAVRRRDARAPRRAGAPVRGGLGRAR